MNIKPIPFKLVAGSEAETRLKRYLRDKTVSLRLGLEKLHGLNGIVKWRKAYEASPNEEKRQFPWENASNLVVPIIAIHSDTLLARVMSAVMKTNPMWVVREFGDFAANGQADGLRDALEEFLQYVGLEPTQLDLYRVYHEWFGETIRLGTSILKCPWFKEVEDQFGPAGDMSGGNAWSRVTKYEGPRPEKLKFENFKCPVNRATIEDMSFKYDVVTLERDELEERKYRGIYDSAAVDIVLSQPNRTSGQTVVQAQKEKDANVTTVPGYGFAEWDIYECHFKYRTDLSHYSRLIVWYHEKSNQILRSFHHYYPDELYLAARLFYRDDMFHGMGFAEILMPFQEEISEIHNQRRDNMTVANIKLFRADPDSKLHKGFRIAPSVMIPAKKDELEPLEFGTPVSGEIDSERLSLELAEKRSGVSPPMQGSGAGTNTKRGVYTAMGTLSLLQEGNTRTDLNITDIRYAHTRLGRLLCREYGHFGVNEDLLDSFGERAPKIKQALEAIASGKMALPVYASSASVNREVEKQADMMLMGVAEKYREGILQLMQQVNGPMMDETTKKQAVEEIKAAHKLMQMVYRHFGYDEVDRLAPKPEITVPPPQQGPQSQQPPQGQQPGIVPPTLMGMPPGGNGRPM